MIRLILALLAAMLVAQPALADRVKDLGSFQGIRSNQLTGYGIVVGLPGTGDDNLEYTVQSLKGVASRFGLQLPANVNPGLKNSAAVLITAELPAFAKPGQRIDITVAALGKSKSLRGGSLVLTPLIGAQSAAAAVLIWRFVTYYFYLLAGFPIFIATAGKAFLRMMNKRKAAAKH